MAGIPPQVQEIAQKTIDPSLVTATLTSPWWFETIEPALQTFMLVAGVVLIVLRIAISVKEFMKK